MRKQITIFAILLLFGINTIAQVRPARRREYNAFLESTTLVVKDQNPFSGYNKKIKEEMERFWTITPFEIITFEEFEQKRTDDSYSFMILADIKQDRLPHVYQFINFAIGHPSRIFNRMPDLGSVPLAYRYIDEDNYLYKMGVFVQYMQRQVEERASRRSFSLTKFLDVKDGAIHEMELWLLEDELAPDVNTVEKIAQYYPYSVRIVTRSDIELAIIEQRDDVAILHKIGPEDTLEFGRGKTWKFIVTVKGAEILYTSDHDVDRENPDAFLKDDFEKLAK